MQTDTENLLKECDAGIRMGVDSLKDMEDNIKNERMKKIVISSRREHETLEDEALKILGKHHTDGKEPNAMAKGMSWLKTNVKIVTSDTDSTVAGLVTDGCNMGIKSLCKYVNQYKNADDEAKDIAERLIKIEDDLCREMRIYL